ncbi:MAG TPA: N-acetylneuraminate synthase [Polyangia bacterium]|nr:N-acetylneuraminate synthase [Polyangia bacterium]
MKPGRVHVIAEAGVNHNGSLDRALELIDQAARAGADSVKFQTFKSEHVISRRAPKAAYQEKTTGTGESQLDMVRKLELDAAAHRQLVARCRERGVQFLSTPFDVGSVALLTELGVPRLKLPSGEITNLLLLRAAAATGLPIILSTGMSTLGDIEAALAVLAAGWGAPFASDEGQRLLRERIILLHCTTEYPAPLEDVNLRAMETMRAAFGLPVGYSDHTDGIAVATAAVALGAVVIEKHFTLDRNLPGPDHKASLEPRELQAMIASIRAVEQALGHALKAPSPSEAKNVAIARKSLTAARAIRRGEPFTVENLTAKRPGSGISPMRFDEFLGRLAARDYEEDEPIDA